MMETEEKRALVSKGMKTLEESADFLGISRSGVLRLISTGEIVSAKVGHRRNVPVVELERYVMKGLDLDRRAAPRNKGAA